MNRWRISQSENTAISCKGRSRPLAHADLVSFIALFYDVSSSDKDVQKALAPTVPTPVAPAQTRMLDPPGGPTGLGFERKPRRGAGPALPIGTMMLFGEGKDCDAPKGTGERSSLSRHPRPRDSTMALQSSGAAQSLLR